MISIYPESFEQKVGFDKIRELVSNRCLCPLGIQKLNETRFSASFELINQQIKQTNEMKTICLLEDSFPVDNYIDPTSALNRIKLEGTWLTEIELFDLKRSLESIKALLSFFVRKEESKYPYLKELTKEVSYYPYITERIDAIVNRFGKIKDNASPELARIRAEISTKQNSVTKKIHAILKSAQAEGIIESDASTSIRDGRVVIPVAAGNKRKIKGFVHDESATGKTVYIEPVEIVELNNEIRELEYDEKREIVRILIDFTDSIRPYLAELLTAYDFLGTIDFIRAKALFAIDVQGTMPILTKETSLFYRKAKHPILFLALKKEKKEVVPLDIQLTKENRIVLISGPNAGGKSVCLKTVGLLQYMFQCGFLPTLLENSELGIFNRIFIDIGDEQSIENDLSTYSSHLINMKNFIKNSDSNSLILIDEFGAGTEPSVGGAIAESILQIFLDQQIFGVITTHYTNLKHFASGQQGIVNGAMLFDTSKIEPMFKLEIGKPGSSFAFEIARKIGLPESVLNSASEKVGEGHVTFEKHLREISRDKHYWEKKRDNIRITNKKVEELEKQLETELLSIRQQRKELISKAKKEAEFILSETNRQIEKTIRDIKEANAEKEKTKKIRSELESFKDDFQEKLSDDEANIQRKIDQIKERQKRREERKQNKKTDSKEVIIDFSDEEILKIGTKVKLKDQEIVGEILEINPKNAVVAFGQMMTSVDLDRLEKISSSEYKKMVKSNPQTMKPSGFDMHKQRLNFKSDIDIRGYRADEALQEVQELVDKAMMFGISQVRVLHGKGNGILRQLIRDYLATIPGIKSYADEHLEHGGSGITVIKIDT